MLHVVEEVLVCSTSHRRHREVSQLLPTCEGEPHGRCATQLCYSSGTGQLNKIAVLLVPNDKDTVCRMRGNPCIPIPRHSRLDYERGQHCDSPTTSVTSYYLYVLYKMFIYFINRINQTRNNSINFLFVSNNHNNTFYLICISRETQHIKYKIKLV